MKLLKPFLRRVNKVIAAAEINGSSKTAQGSELLTVKLIYCPRMKLIEANDQKETSSSAVSQLPRCLGRRNQSPLPSGRIKSRLGRDALSVVHVSRERQKRKILAIQIVFEIKHTRKSGAGDLRLVP